MNRNILSFVALAILIGCNRSTPPISQPAPRAAQNPAVTSLPVEVKPSVAEEIDDSVVVEKATETSSEQPPATVNAPPPKTGRVMLLTNMGPMLLDLHVAYGKESVISRFDRAVDEVMKIARGDQSDAVTWKTLLIHPRFKDGQFGNPASGTYQAQTEMIRQYDTTQNGRVDRNELIRYLTNNQTSQAISFLTSNDRRSESREASPLALWLDRNEDGKLDAKEIATASERLQLRDANDDALLTPNELVDAAPTNNGMMTPRPRRRKTLEPKAGWLFSINDAEESWSDIRVAWETLYSGSQPVRREDLAFGSRLFDELDLDTDGQLDNIEMEMLAEIDADLELKVDFGVAPPRVELLASRIPPASIYALIQLQSNRLTLRLSNTVLDLFAVSAAEQASIQQDSQSQLFLDQTDKNKDGELTPEEYATANAPFLQLPFVTFDLDGNNILSKGELDTIARQRGQITRNLLRIRADNQGDALFPTLDANADGRLDAREIANAPNALSGLDHDGDGIVRNSEYTSAMLVGVVLGSNANPQIAADVSLRAPIVRRAASGSTPIWFRGMDRNEDQSISWREFLGTKQQFQALDANADGFVDHSEAGRG